MDPEPSQQRQPKRSRVRYREFLKNGGFEMGSEVIVVRMDELSMDYLGQLDLETLADTAAMSFDAAQKHRDQAWKVANASVVGYINAGKCLLAAKAKVKHGQWGQWLQDNWSATQEWARQLMEAAEANSKHAWNLQGVESFRHLQRLIADTPEAQAKAADRAQRKLAAAPVAPKPANPATPAPARRELDAPAGQPPGTMHGQSYHTRPLPGSDESPATTPVASPQPAWQPEQSQKRERITTTVPTPREHAPRPMMDTVGQALAGGEWFDHWWWHNPAGGQERVTRADIVAAAEHIGEPKPIVERTLEIFGTADVIRVMVAQAGTGKSALDLARQLQKAAEALLASEGKAPPKATVPTVEVLAAYLNDYADVQVWSTPLSDAAGNWAAYKQSLAPAERIRTLDSWSATLKRMGKLAGTYGEAFVADMIEKSIANGWTGWEHLDAVKRSPAAVKSGRKTNDDWGIQYETVEG